MGQISQNDCSTFDCFELIFSMSNSLCFGGSYPAIWQHARLCRLRGDCLLILLILAAFASLTVGLHRMLDASDQ
jgi:hypothetical protein